MYESRQYLMTLLILSLMHSGQAYAQRISFGTYATDDIVLTALGTGELNFNSKQAVIRSGDVISINLADESAAVLSIEGNRHLDVTLSIEAPLALELDASNSIPLALSFAYSNQGLAEAAAKAAAIEVPAGFTSATFPLQRRAAGTPPPPPPTPGHGGYTAPRATAYVYIYGSLGTVPSNAAAGLYSGQINVRVEYSTYE